MFFDLCQEALSIRLQMVAPGICYSDAATGGKVLKQIALVLGMLYSTQHNANLRVCWKNVPCFSVPKLGSLDWRGPFGDHPQRLYPALLPYHSQTHNKFYVDGGLEGRHPVVVRCDKFAILVQLIAETDWSTFRYSLAQPTTEEVYHLAPIQVRLFH